MTEDQEDPLLLVLFFVCGAFCFYMGTNYEKKVLVSPCAGMVEEREDQRVNEISSAWMAGYGAGRAGGFDTKSVVVDEDGNTHVEHRWFTPMLGKPKH